MKTYLYHLALNLGELRGTNGVDFFPFLDRIPDLDHERSSAGWGTTVLRLGAISLVNRGMVPPHWLIPKCDVFHASNQVRRPMKGAKNTATIHDLTSWTLPQFHVPGTIATDHEYAQRMLQPADALIAVSQRTKLDAVEILGIPEGRIHVIHHGVPEEYRQVPAEDIAAVKERCDLPKPYILFVSTIEPRKNLDSLIDAYEGLKPDLRHEFDLVVVGPAGWNSEATMRRLRGDTPGLRYLGYRPETDLPGLVAGASVFVYPSFYEGFGLPVLQAMATGTPVITSHAGALPEVAGACAAFVDPHSSSDISATLSRILESPSERSEMSEKGRARALDFRWESSAAATWRFFESVAGGA